jgi:DNA-binding response OmpR family regulator
MAENRVMVIDDDDSLRDVIAEALREDGYAVQAVDNGQSALELVKSWPPDLVILDLMMPYVDGAQFCAAIREMHDMASVPIIVVSAARSAAEVGAKLGATASLSKPFDLFELTERVDHLLRSDSGSQRDC